MFYNPVNVLESNDFIKTIQEITEKRDLNNSVIITTDGAISRFNLYRYFNKELIYSSVKSNPTISDCQNLLAWLKNTNPDSIIAIGGGSTLDSAKVVKASLCNNIYNTYKLLELNEFSQNELVCIHVPTTHGTGSEVTQWATIWDHIKKTKYSLSNKNLYPDYAILDANLVMQLPLKNSLISTLDALSHSFESIWNINKNIESTKYAIKAICLIFKYSVELKKGINTREVKEKLLKASNLAGMAFSNTKTAAAHSISYPLTQYYNIPHGIAASMPLNSLIDINYHKIISEISIILEKNKLKNIEQLKNKISDIPRGVVKYSLREYGVKKKDIIKIIIPKSNTPERMKNNIVDIDNENIKFILESIY